MFRFLLITFLLILTSQVQAKIAQDWFKYNSEQNQYSIAGNALHPAAVFQKISLHSGIEIRYDKSLVSGMNLDIHDASFNEVLEFIDLKYSTLKAYSKNAHNQEVLTSLSILPKGQFQSGELLLALDPVTEAVAHKQQSTTPQAQQVYVTRIQQLELKVQKELSELADKEIERGERQEQRRQDHANRKQAKKNTLVKKLQEIKQTDPETYQRQLKIMSWKYPNLENDINKPDEVAVDSI